MGRGRPSGAWLWWKAYRRRQAGRRAGQVAPHDGGRRAGAEAGGGAEWMGAGGVLEDGVV